MSIDFHKENILIQKLTGFYTILSEVTQDLPKSEKYILGERLKNLALDLLEITFSVNFSKNLQDKLEKITQLSIKLDLLKLLVRLTFEMKFINQKSYIKLQESLVEIGKIIGGWLKKARASF